MKPWVLFLKDSLSVGHLHREAPRRRHDQQRAVGDRVRARRAQQRRPRPPSGLLPRAPLQRVHLRRRRHEEFCGGKLSRRLPLRCPGAVSPGLCPLLLWQDRENAQSSCAGLFIGSHLGFDWPGVWVHVDIASPVHAVSSRPCLLFVLQSKSGDGHNLPGEGSTSLGSG